MCVCRKETNVEVKAELTHLLQRLKKMDDDDHADKNVRDFLLDAM